VLAGALTAGVWLAAGDADARAPRRAAGGGKAAAEVSDEAAGRIARGRMQSDPQAMLQGRLTQNRQGQWQIGDQPLVFEAHAILLDTQQGCRRALPKDGREAFVMGYHRKGRFVVYSGLLTEPRPPQPLGQVAVTDQTEAEALAAAGYPGLDPDEVPR
jgi:hypothetical protein